MNDDASPRRLRTIDLFSGVGGIALGLAPLCRVVAYCEFNEDARRTLVRNMKLERLDAAPVIPDVRDFPENMFAEGDIDLVTMGFPCKDISGCGNRRGFDTTAAIHRVRRPHVAALEGRSSLFHAGMAIVARCAPRHVFLENVANLTSMPDVWGTVMARLDGLGFDARFGVLGACDVGAPHTRRRWFCLATRRGEPWPDVAGLETAFSSTTALWNARGRNPREDCSWEVAGVPRMVGRRDPHGRERLRQLGNMCVPQCAAAAFRALSGGLVDASCSRDAKRCRDTSHRLPRWGRMSEGGVVTGCKNPVPPCRTNLHLILLPERGVVRGHSRRRHPLLAEPARKRLWATPRAGGLNREGSPGIGSLTCRTKQDLSTQLFHERGTRVQGRQENPDYVEWMMGLPEAWTTSTHGEAGAVSLLD